MKATATCFSIVLILSVFLNVGFAESFIIKNGQPNTEIVVPQSPQSSVKLAANELQGYLKKITGAEIPINTEPSADFPVKIYLGTSRHTERLGVTDEGLECGAFRIQSGGDWLVLLGWI